MILLLESKRDDLLLPYFELVKDKIPGLTLGKFKGLMLDKLAAQGNINNLSLGSNFYLAGATKYYFQGELTSDKHVALLSGDVNAMDNWNREACQKLNIVINILRNAYIDTVGTKFEVEEDFGNLSIAKLFRKYGKKINAELGNETGEEEEDTLDRNPRVGNGYTFDILHSYEDATKYNEYTSPGAWCITYAQVHYNNYINMFSNYGGIHYVIFLKDGYEDVPRKKGPGFTYEKPHDEYGNSMIAFLQRNDSWKPTYITSRWNHGYGYGEPAIEADYAYTLEEFCEITGVTPEDLQRIYEIWRKDEEARKKNGKMDNSAKKIVINGMLRKLKYAQMMINNGQDPEECILSTGAMKRGVLWGNGEQRKSVIEYLLHDKESGIFIIFFCDRTNIVFDSVMDEGEFTTASKFWFDGRDNGKDIILIRHSKYNKIYSVRYHSLVDIDGITKFKKIPEGTNIHEYEVLFIEIKNSFKDVALLSMSNCKPLKLPNGRCWFNRIINDNPRASNYEPRNEIIAHAITDLTSPIFEIIYDESSGEKYFYSWKAKKFLPELNFLKNPFTEEVPSYAPNAARNPADYRLRIASNLLKGVTKYTAAFFTPDDTEYHRTSYILLDENGKQISIYGETSFNHLDSVGNRFLVISDGSYWTGSDRYYYDMETKKYLAIGKNKLNIRTNSYCSCINRPRFYFFTPKDVTFSSRGHGQMIYDSQTGLFVKNPLSKTEKYKDYPPYMFILNREGDEDGTGVMILKDDFDYWSYCDNLRTGRGLSYRDAYEMGDKEMLNHILELPLDGLEYIPNNLPVNNEHEDDMQYMVQNLANNFTPNMAESTIKKIVAETINKLLNNR